MIEQSGVPKPSLRRPSGLKLDISITDTDIFKNILDVLEDIFQDERIDKDVRCEYFKKTTKDNNLDKMYYFRPME